MFAATGTAFSAPPSVAYEVYVNVPAGADRVADEPRG
ncbi:MAG: hypothetical protein JWM87_966 [Candidatus Eremiobacteraeota bacterium]|nr:hypothetical protein [Candidatus Eremiobacteraeota bacterium]